MNLKFLCVLLAAIVFFVCQESEAGEPAHPSITAIVKADVLRVRSAPSTDAQIIAKIPQNTTVQIVESLPSMSPWVRIYISSSKGTGWVHGDYLRQASEQSTSQPEDAADAQNNVPSVIANRYKQIVSLVSENNAEILSELIEYPLQRENPLPDIATRQEFIEYYSIIFDDNFKDKLQKYADAYVFARNGFYGLVGGPFNGEMWINEKGKIVTVNYSSPAELKLKNQITARQQEHVHQSVSDWKENVLVGQSKKFLIRIDRTDKGLRYVSWSKGKSVSEDPDLILFGGSEERQGTMGGWTYSFVNGEWTYVIYDVRICERPDQCGLFLRLLLNGVEKSEIKLDEIK